MPPLRVHWSTHRPAVITGIPDPTTMYIKKQDKPDPREAAWIRWFGVGLLGVTCACFAC